MHEFVDEFFDAREDEGCSAVSLYDRMRFAVISAKSPMNAALLSGCECARRERWRVSRSEAIKKLRGFMGFARCRGRRILQIVLWLDMSTPVGGASAPSAVLGG